MALATAQIATISHAQRLYIGKMYPLCFQLWSGPSQACQFAHITNIQINEKDTTSVTVVNACRLQERETSGIELF